jgi:hypothetical protein
MDEEADAAGLSSDDTAELRQAKAVLALKHALRSSEHSELDGGGGGGGRGALPTEPSDLRRGSSGRRRDSTKRCSATTTTRQSNLLVGRPG